MVEGLALQERRLPPPECPVMEGVGRVEHPRWNTETETDKQTETETETETDRETERERQRDGEIERQRGGEIERHGDKRERELDRERLTERAIQRRARQGRFLFPLFPSPPPWALREGGAVGVVEGLALQERRLPPPEWPGIEGVE